VLSFIPSMIIVSSSASPVKIGISKTFETHKRIYIYLFIYYNHLFILTY